MGVVKKKLYNYIILSSPLIEISTNFEINLNKTNDDIISAIKYAITG